MKRLKGFGGLPRQEKLYFSVCILDGEVYNGGFHQFFFNYSGEHYHEAFFGLAELGAFHSRELLSWQHVEHYFPMEIFLLIQPHVANN
jgi:Domain of unknown function (DUF4375)